MPHSRKPSPECRSEVASAEIASVKTQLDASKSELATNQAELDKAKRGVEKFKQVNTTFAEFDALSTELSTILENFNQAYDERNISSMQYYSDQYTITAQKLQSKYDTIQRLIAEFNSGNY